MNHYVGTSGYSYKEWKGTFYPPKLPAKEMLAYYGEHFRTVEINYTFKRLPTAAVLHTWASAVPADFTFALKAPEQITHRKRLKDSDAALTKFLAVAGQLKKRLGPLLFQLPPNFKKDAARLRAFLRLLPRRRSHEGLDLPGPRRLGRIRRRRPASVHAQQQRHRLRAAAERPQLTSTPKIARSSRRHSWPIGSTASSLHCRRRRWLRLK